MCLPSGLNATLLPPPGVTRQGQHLLARRRVPHLERSVSAPRHDAPAVAAEGHARDLTRVLETCPETLLSLSQQVIVLPAVQAGGLLIKDGLGLRQPAALDTHLR